MLLASEGCADILMIGETRQAGAAAVRAVWLALRAGLRGLGVADRQGLPQWYAAYGLGELRPNAQIPVRAQGAILTAVGKVPARAMCSMVALHLSRQPVVVASALQTFETFRARAWAVAPPCFLTARTVLSLMVARAQILVPRAREQ